MNRTGCLAVVAVFLVAICLFLAAPSWARRSLPWNATEIKEYYADTRFGSDFTRCLKAKINAADFPAFADRLNLTRTYNDKKDRMVNVQWPSCPEPWWDPPASIDGARIELLPDPNYYALAKYHEGYVYFAVFSW